MAASCPSGNEEPATDGAPAATRGPDCIGGSFRFGCELGGRDGVAGSLHHRDDAVRGTVGAL